MSAKIAAFAASYRVPTRREMQDLVDRITTEILAGRGIRYWQSGQSEWVPGISLCDNSDEFMIHLRGGRIMFRRAELLSRDSFEVVTRKGAIPGVVHSIVPAWLERRSA